MPAGTVVDDNTISVKVYLGYDATMLAAEAIRRSGDNITGENVNTQLETIEGMEGMTGTIGFSPDSHQPIGLSMVMYVIKEGVNEKLGRYVPEIHKVR